MEAQWNPRAKILTALSAIPGQRSLSAKGSEKSANLKEGEHQSSEKEGTFIPCSDCELRELKCCLQVSWRCGQGKELTWVHLSSGEHFCIHCFDYYYCEDEEGNKEFDSFSAEWSEVTKTDPSVKLYVVNEVLPYWIECTVPHCKKWREVPYMGSSFPSSAAHLLPADVKDFYPLDKDLSPVDIQNFVCSNHAVEQDPRVSRSLESKWMSHLFLPRFRGAPAFNNLSRYGINAMICPLLSSFPIKVLKYIQLSLEMQCESSPIWISRKRMEERERKSVPKSVMHSSLYLGLRNLIIAVWYTAPDEWVTTQKVSLYLNCRGLVRVALLSYADDIIKLLTWGGVVNYGLVSPVPSFPDVDHAEVVVIGAGVAGLSAARHFRNVGIKAVVLESNSRIGGRVCDDSEGYKGAQFVCGLVNNPFVVLAYQGNFTLEILPSNPVFINANGTIIGNTVIERMLSQFSGVMHGALELAKEKNSDSSWYETIIKHQKIYQENADHFTTEEQSIFSLFLRLYEIDSRTKIEVQTLQWHEFPKVIGCDGYIVEGLSCILSDLAKDLDIKLNSRVISVRCESNGIKVETDNSDTFTASKVLVTVPFPVLRDKQITFHPVLDDQKVNALKEMEKVTHEKIFLQFRSRFWKKVVGENQKFAIVSEESSLPFPYFIDVTDQMKRPTLLTFITDCMSSSIENKSDEIIEMCLDCLKIGFKNFGQDIPKLVEGTVTHWAIDQHVQTSGSCVKVGHSYELYDQIAKPIDDTIFFAGEATFRTCPNSVVGAFLSGLRGAVRITDLIRPVGTLKSHNARPVMES